MENVTVVISSLIIWGFTDLPASYGPINALSSTNTLCNSVPFRLLKEVSFPHHTFYPPKPLWPFSYAYSSRGILKGRISVFENPVRGDEIGFCPQYPRR